MPFGVPLWYVDWNPGNGSDPVARVVPVEISRADCDRNRRTVYYTTREGARRLAVAVRCYRNERDAYRELYRRAESLRRKMAGVVETIRARYVPDNGK